MKITPSDINGLVGIVPTPATRDADRWDCAHSVDLAESERMTNIVVDAGTDILMTTGTFGECASLTERELQDFVAVVVDATGGRRPVFAGIGTLNTRETIRRGRALIDAGADGLFVGRPMWLALDDAGIVRFYRNVAEALPGVPLVIYDNPIAFKGKISQDAYVELGKLREVVAAKHVGGPALESDAKALRGRCRILPLASDWVRAAKADPELMTAAWTGHVACAPAPLAALAAAIKRQDWDRATAISNDCNWAESVMFAGGDLAQFMNYSIQIGHLRFAAAGLIDPGPARLPYVDVPEHYRTAGIECGKRWAELQRRFAASKIPA